MARPLAQVLLEKPELVRGLKEDPATFRFPEGALLTVAAVHWRPHIVVTTDADGRRKVTGPMGNVLTVLAQTLNFTYNVVSPADGSWGSEGSNGTWSGMVGQASRKEVDIALGPFGITYSRTKVVDFTESLFFDARGILSRKGIPEIDPWGFLYPLTWSVWVALSLALVVVWLATAMVGRRPGQAVSLGWAGKVILQNVRVLLNQGNCLQSYSFGLPYYSFAFLSFQRFTEVVLGHGGVVVLGSWVVVAAVVFWSYTCTLTSLLAVRFIPQPIQTLRDLLDDTSVNLIMLPMTIITDTISQMTFGELKELHELNYVGRIRYERTSAFRDMLETVVRHDGYSLMDTTLTIDLLIAGDFLKTNKCDFYKSRQTFFTTTHCMIAQRESPLVSAINHRVRAVVESGLYEFWLMNEIPAITTCRFSPSTVLVREPLSVANLWGLFVVLGAGLILATTVFVLELIVSPRTKNRP
ncbi:probable glutamate receptor [Eriocheir sinensis]|uniref:probable glutamate receptor n=1 Tax=Eriocheir sinensis TaxID=95602 RepID=UPI0021C97093|nr:probable glutamate receptor [Eriocheir sinensis]